jgi:hypothetical protein
VAKARVPVTLAFHLMASNPDYLDPALIARKKKESIPDAEKALRKAQEVRQTKPPTGPGVGNCVA